jgi:hypothetical protein
MPLAEHDQQLLHADAEVPRPGRQRDRLGHERHVDDPPAKGVDVLGTGSGKELNLDVPESLSESPQDVVRTRSESGGSRRDLEQVVLPASDEALGLPRTRHQLDDQPSLVDQRLAGLGEIDTPGVPDQELGA